VVVSFADVTAMKERERELVHHALHDPLTDLPNRRYFLEHLDRVVLHGPHPRPEADALLYVDLDGFKRVNDRYGHSMGDAVLVEVGRRMLRAVRAPDVVARLAGDEFGVLFADVGDAERVAALGRELVAALSRPFEIGGLVIRIGASAGLTRVQREDDDPKEVLDRADASLRRAKEEGKGRLVEFSPEADMEARRVVQLERDLSFAREHGELSLEYAPIVPLRGGGAVAERARLRWRHPRFGDIPPARVRALLRDTGLAGELDRWILREALARIAERSSNGRGVPVAVPVAEEQLVSGGPDLFREVLAASGVEPRRLVLAVHAADDAENDALVEVVEGIGALGVGLMLTAAGEARSRSRRAPFPYQWLGVHPAAIARSVADEPGSAMMRGVLDSLRRTGVRTVAETDADGRFDVEVLDGLGFGFVVGSAFGEAVEAAHSGDPLEPA